jgi:serine/threonine protein kinase
MVQSADLFEPDVPRLRARPGGKFSRHLGSPGIAHDCRHIISQMPTEPVALGPYKLGACIQSSSFSLVQRCLSPKGRKLIAKVYQQSETSTKIFKNEIDVLRSFTTRSIVRCLDSFESNGRYIVILEDGGENLFDFLSHTNLSEAKVRYLARQMFHAVKSVHDLRITHGDIKLENFVINSKDRIRLIDFGSAERIADGGTSTAVCGSQFYRPPELIQNKLHDQKVDIWALAISLFALAMRGFPFDCDPGDHEYSVLLEPPVMQGASQLFSPEFANLVEWMLTKDPANRPTIEQCLQHQWFQADLENV